MLKAHLIFQKALYQLDRELYDKAVDNLEKSISLAKAELDNVTLASAMCCLGEYLLTTNNRNRAKAVFTELISYGFEGELFETTLRNAKEHLAQMDS